VDGDCPVSGKCRISFRDEDGDGYGTSNGTTGRCDGSIPSGFASFEGDCCDNGGDLAVAAQINPAQEEYFEVPANICGIDWDYDCSGEVEFGGKKCGTGGCSDTTEDFKLTDCGSTANLECAADEDMCETVLEPLTPADCGTSFGLTSCTCTGAPTKKCRVVGSVNGRQVHCR
jgi:hypothetical protein